MVLTDREIQIAIENKDIWVDPEPEQEAYSSTSLDLTLDKTLTRFKPIQTGMNLSIDPSLPGFNFNAILKDTTVDFQIPEDGYPFKPNEMILGYTREYIKLNIHSRVAARVEGKSSLARLGVSVHLTAPIIHAGFEGQIRLEMKNHNSVPIILRTGMRVCQLVFEQTLGTPVRGYKGRFSGQVTCQN